MINTTIVSCFLANSNTRDDRKLNNYIELGKKLIKINTPKIIFIDDKIIDSIINSIEYNKEHSLLLPFNEKDIYLYEHKENINNFRILTDFPKKDTLDYMLLICNKTEIMKKAIEINAFQTEQFVWVDFGINHIFKCGVEEFEKKIIHLTNQEYYNVRIGSILRPKTSPFRGDIYRQVAWYFAGGIFGGLGDALIKFADLVKEKCFETIYEKGTLMWEVNIWYMVFLENEDLFDPYLCDHNETLITHY
jgi:hypothetical protein